ESVDDEVRSHGPGLVEHADEEHDQRDRDEHLADREARVDVVADVAALGARVAGTHEALIAIHDADAGLIAPPAHLVAGALVRSLAVSAHERLLVPRLLLAALGRGAVLLLLGRTVAGNRAL